MSTSTLSILVLLERIETFKREQASKNLAELDQMDRRRFEIWNWHEAERNSILQQTEADPNDPASIYEKGRERSKLLAALSEAHEKRQQDPGLLDHEKKLDAYLGEKEDPDLIAMEAALSESKRIQRFRKWRLALDLTIPLLLSALAAYIFIFTLISRNGFSGLASYLFKSH